MGEVYPNEGENRQNSSCSELSGVVRRQSLCAGAGSRDTRFGVDPSTGDNAGIAADSHWRRRDRLSMVADGLALFRDAGVDAGSAAVRRDGVHGDWRFEYNGGIVAAEWFAEVSNRDQPGIGGDSG